jgi:ribosomal protein S18 acetylase RimI-like enzyme
VDDLTFDLASAEDGARLLEFARAFHAEDGHSLDSQGEEAIAQLPGEPMARCWLIREHGSSIGYVVLTLGYSIEYGGRNAFIDDLYLVPDARGRGVGTHVMGFVEDQAVALGVRALHLEVDVDNLRAQELYRRSGFTESGRRLLSKRLNT